ncbi:MAG: peptidylprolyl isomerase [Pirellulaceae bacterium]|nr:peptidyl-prolyl cis-trans isomerase [Planctomycetales bacterium]
MYINRKPQARGRLATDGGTVVGWVAVRCGLVLGLLIAAPLETGAQVPVVPGVGATAQAAAGAAAAAGVAGVPATPPPTIWDFLGVPQFFRGTARLGTRVRHRLNRALPFGKPLPPLELPPPEKASPQAAAAGEAMEVEASAEVNAQALRYLGKFGCSTTCFPKNEAAIYNGLTDCMETTRLASVQAALGSVSGRCPSCSRGACCSARIQEQLCKLGFGKDAHDCWQEPSPRIRRLARLALSRCRCVEILDESTNPDRERVYEELPPGHPSSDAPLESIGVTEDPVSESVALVSSTEPLELDRRIIDLREFYTEEADASPFVLARVNGQPIVLSDLFVDDGPHSAQISLDEFRRRVERAIDRKLLIAEAYRTRFIVSKKLLEGRSAVVEQELADAFLTALYPLDRSIPEGDLRRFWQQHPERFTVPGAVQWERLSIPTYRYASREAAWRVAVALQAAIVNAANHKVGVGDDAMERVGETDGILVTVSARVPRDHVPEGIASAIAELPVGGVSDVVAVEEGFEIYRVLGRTPEVTRNFDAVANEALAAVQTANQQARREMLIRLRRSATFWQLPMESLFENETTAVTNGTKGGMVND